MPISKCLFCNKCNDRKMMYKNIRFSTSKDKNTGEEINKSKNEYFCNENCFKEYEKIINERKFHKEIINIICSDILRCPFNTLMVSGLNENIYKYYSKETVLQYLQEHKDEIFKAVNYKSFDNIVVKIKYMIAVIQNGLVKVKYKDYEKEVEYGYYEPVEVTEHNPKKNKKKGLKELEQEYLSEVI